MQIGVTLPTFSCDARGVLEAAMGAERAGIAGVFCFDHLFPLGHPERPAFSALPMLGAVAAVTEHIRLGTLVARISLVPDAVLAASIEGLHAIAGERLVAGLGTGDDKSAPEQLRNGIPHLGRRARSDSLRDLLARLGASGIECWVGAGNAETNAVAREAGATLNLWGATPEDIERERLESAAAELPAPVTWAGSLPSSRDEAATLLSAIRDAGATWAVWGWPDSIELVVGAARLAGIAL